MASPVVAIFDVGKTNKKLFLFDQQYKIVYEECIQLPEITDEDGFACEDVDALSEWIVQSFTKLNSDSEYNVKAVNVSAYGASFVHIDEDGKPCTPLYNYLKPYPASLQKQFYNNYGGEEELSRQCASPVLGSLNSGLQLFRIKSEQPQLFNEIKYSLHLPQYLSFLISTKTSTDITSVGCHTMLWNFDTNTYHDWVGKEGLLGKFPELKDGSDVFKCMHGGKKLLSGIGLHDSSAALIPYLSSFRESFILISTGTWCISLNPFNHEPLTADELNQDCLCYLTFEGSPVKASRLFAGYHHEQVCKKLSAQFSKPADYYNTVTFDQQLLPRGSGGAESNNWNAPEGSQYSFINRDVFAFETYEEAYHHFMFGLIGQQVKSTRLVLSGANVKQIFVDGGFGKNPIYMHLLALAFPGIKVFAASMAQASAVGAAMVIHDHWNDNAIPNDIISLKYYAAVETAGTGF